MTSRRHQAGLALAEVLLVLAVVISIVAVIAFGVQHSTQQTDYSRFEARAVELRDAPLAQQLGRVRTAIGGLDARRRASHGPRPVVFERRARARSGLRRAVALEDLDADVLPGLLEGRRQEGPAREEQVEVAAELGVDDDLLEDDQLDDDWFEGPDD